MSKPLKLMFFPSSPLLRQQTMLKACLGEMEMSCRGTYSGNSRLACSWTARLSRGPGLGRIDETLCVISYYRFACTPCVCCTFTHRALTSSRASSGSCPVILFLPIGVWEQRGPAHRRRGRRRTHHTWEGTSKTNHPAGLAGQATSLGT